MTTDNPGLLPNLEDIDYLGIGIGAELAAPSSHGTRSQSPGGLSISLEPRGATHDSLYKGNENLLRFRHSSAPSPDSVILGHETSFISVVLEEKDARQVAQPDDDYPPTPVASSSSTLSTTPTFAGPSESYLACPQPHEKLALSLPRDDDREQQAGSSDCGSLVVSNRRVPGVYRPPNRSPPHSSAVAGARDSRFGFLMQRYLASKDVGEVPEDQSGDICSDDGHDDTLKTSIPRSEAAQPSEDVPAATDASTPLTTDPRADNVAPIAGAQDGPIEIGHNRQSPDSGISDMEADELHHIFVEGRKKQQAIEFSRRKEYQEEESKSRNG